jgi:flagellar hook-associated protein 3 FlgL
MRISSQTVSDSIVRQIQQLGNQQAKLQTQVATGQRIFKPEDDPSAVGRVLNLESESRALKQYSRNVDRALELSQSTYSSLQQFKKVSDRGSELGTLGAGVLGNDAAAAYASEVDQLIEQALQLGNSKLRNDYLFAGTATDAAPFTATRNSDGKVTGVTYAGNSDQAAIILSEATSLKPGSTGATNVGLGEYINDLVALRDALLVNDPVAVSTAQAGLLEGEDIIVNSLAEHGGIQARIEATTALLTHRSDDIEGLISSEADIDLPEYIVRLSQSQTAYQAALQSGANIMKLSLLDYIR